MELGARKLKILQAVIEAYIQTGEPVGSKALCAAGRLRIVSHHTE